MLFALQACWEHGCFREHFDQVAVDGFDEFDDGDILDHLVDHSICNLEKLKVYYVLPMLTSTTEYLMHTRNFEPLALPQCTAAIAAAKQNRRPRVR